MLLSLNFFCSRNVKYVHYVMLMQNYVELYKTLYIPNYRIMWANRFNKTGKKVLKLLHIMS